MRIVVTPRDIVQAAIDTQLKARSRSCPIAQSLIRRGFQEVTVHLDHIEYYADGCYRVRPTPPVAAEWIERYDAHHHVGPFSFELPGVTL